MRRKRKNRLDLKYVIAISVVLVVLVITVLSYTLDKEKKLNFIETITKDTVVGIQRIIYYPFKKFGDLLDEYISLKDVLKENEILKKNIDKVYSIEAENIELKKQILQLKEELDIDYILTDYTYLNATIVSRNTGYWYNTLTLDKGSHNGIEEGMVVINSFGLIGKVINVSKFSCDVRLITTSDTSNKISVTVTDGDNKVTGLINNYDYDKKVLKVEGISNTEAVSVGDYVYTSGLGGVFPSGILIGKVESITTDVYDLSKIINVVPSVNFDDINYVSILKRDDDK